MFDPAPRRGPMTSLERGISIVVLAVLLGLFAAEVLVNYEPLKLSALMILLFWFPLLALHESGHALTAWLLGWKVKQVVVGVGRTVWRSRVGRTGVEVRLLPLEGFVQCAPANLRSPRLKEALIYFAGPGVELVLAGLLLVAVGGDTMLSRSEHFGVLALQSLALAAVAGAVLNLIPHGVQTQNGEVANDGLGILRSFTRPDSYYADLIGSTCDNLHGDRDDDDPADWWKR